MSEIQDRRGQQGVPPLRAASGARVNADVGFKNNMNKLSQIGLMLLMCMCANTAALAQLIPHISLERGTPLIINLKGVPTPLKIEDVIDEKGNINLPYIGELLAAGKSLDELTATIKASYLSTYPDADVEIIIAPSRFIGSEESKRPGVYPDFDADVSGKYK